MDNMMKKLVFFAKCLLYQGNFNLDNMQGSGFAWLCKGELSEKGAMFKSYFNTNPAFISLVFGIFLREYKNKGDKAFLIRNSYASACAALGDSFFWHGLKPFLFLTALTVCAITSSPWGIVVYPCLYTLIYMLFILLGRRVGESLGDRSVMIFNKIRLNQWADHADSASLFLLGFLLIRYFKSVYTGDLLQPIVLAVLFVAGFLAHKHVRPIMFMLLLAVWILINLCFFGGVF
jgi:mannose/fructose/N-acetylgalactosamine-specific phosphotransferase system component IID